jgi:tetratricopeptide (TPR) repeat protein
MLPDSPDVQIVTGLLAQQKRDLPAARAAFERALARSPSNIEALERLVQLDLQAKRGDAARARIDAALQAQPANADLLLLSSDTYAATGDRARALEAARNAIERDPNNLDAYVRLGRTYLAAGQIEQATSQFQTLAAKQPDSVGANTVVGLLLEMQHKTAEARAAYEHVLQIDPRAAVASNNLAWILAEQGGDLNLALQYAQAAKAKLPSQPEVNDTLGWIYQKKGLSGLAVPPLEDAVAKEPKNAGYLYHLGAAYAGTGDKTKARAALDKALNLGLSAADAAAAKRVLEGLKN